MGYIKGQKLRIMVDGAVVALATNCQVHLAAQMEDASTKDDADPDWQTQEVVGRSWDMATDALFSISHKSLMTTLVSGTAVEVEFNYETDDGGSGICSGSAYVTDISINSPNRQNATFTAQFQGNGPLNIE